MIRQIQRVCPYEIPDPQVALVGNHPHLDSVPVRGSQTVASLPKVGQPSIVDAAGVDVGELPCLLYKMSRALLCCGHGGVGAGHLGGGLVDNSRHDHDRHHGEAGDSGDDQQPFQGGQALLAAAARPPPQAIIEMGADAAEDCLCCLT